MTTILTNSLNELDRTIVRMQFAEPMTMLTDYLWGICLIYLIWLLNRHKESDTIGAVKQFQLAFGLLAIAALTGGTTHGFALILPQWVLNIIWKITLFSTGISNYFFLLGSITLCPLTERSRLYLRWIAIFILVIYSVLAIITSNFRIVLLDYLPTIGILAYLQTLRRSQFEESVRWFVRGIALVFVVAGIYLFQLDLALNFNHNDFAHTLLIGVSYLFYRGIILSKENIIPL